MGRDVNYAALKRALHPPKNLALPRTEPATRPTNVLHDVAGGAMSIIGLPFQGIDMLNVGFAKLTAPLSNMLPTFPAAHLGSLCMGLPHAHYLHPPSGPNPLPIPVPIPLPPIGTVLLGTSVQVLINGLPAARCGDMGISPTCCGLPPFFEVFTGSSKVFIGGARAARQFDVTFHCKPVPSGAAAVRGAAAAMKVAMKAMMYAGFAAQALSAAGDAVEAAKADDPAMGSALALNSSMTMAQMANDAAAIAAGLLMGKDPCLPPGTLGTIALGSGDVGIGGFPMPLWVNVAKGLLKGIKALRNRRRSSRPTRPARGKRPGRG